MIELNNEIQENLAHLEVVNSDSFLGEFYFCLPWKNSAFRI